jgi:hypothetical protein
MWETRGYATAPAGVPQSVIDVSADDAIDTSDDHPVPAPADNPPKLPKSVSLDDYESAKALVIREQKASIPFLQENNFKGRKANHIIKALESAGVISGYSQQAGARVVLIKPVQSVTADDKKIVNLSNWRTER